MSLQMYNSRRSLYLALVSQRTSIVALFHYLRQSVVLRFIVMVI